MKKHVIALYGSTARGENDHLSDKDVLIICDEKIEAPFEIDSKLSISRYSWAEFEQMAAYGSLFLRHVKSEGFPIKYNKKGLESFQSTLSKMSQYQLVNRDLLAFRNSILDVEEAIEMGDSSFEFEVASLATVVRHASILGCYLIKSPTFGRYAAVEVFSDARGLPREIIQDFPVMYGYRLAVARDLPMPAAPDRVQLLKWIDLAKLLVEEVSLC